MKFFTKDYYRNFFAEDLYFKEDERAKVFSNKLFEEYIAGSLEPFDPYASLREREQLLSDYRCIYEDILFDYPSYLEKLMTPEEIAAIPDIRLLGLGIASPEVAGLLNSRLEALRSERKAADKNYAKYLSESPKAFSVYNRIYKYLHDKMITDVSMDKGDLVLQLKTDGFFQTLTFFSAKILKSETDLTGKFILESEVYFSDGFYETDFLLGDKYDSLFYYDLRSTDINSETKQHHRLIKSKIRGTVRKH